jgi:hypothetical protein
MAIEIFKAFPPDQDHPIAELQVRHDGIVDIPAEVSGTPGNLKITLFGRNDGVAWKYPLNEFLGAIARAVDVLGPHSPDA